MNRKLIIVAIAALVLAGVVFLLSNPATGATTAPRPRSGCMTTITFSPDRNPHSRTPAMVQVTYCGPGISTGSWVCTRDQEKRRVVLNCRKISSRPYQF